MNEKPRGRVFFVDTKPRFIKMQIKTKPLIITDDSILISTKGKNTMLDPKLWLGASFRAGGAAGGVIGAVTEHKHHLLKPSITEKQISSEISSMQKIPFKSIKFINLRGLFAGDLAIDLTYENEGKIEKVSFFVVDKINCINSQTKGLFEIIRDECRRINKK